MKCLIPLLLLLASCATNPPVPSWSSGERNACVPEAAVMCEGLRKAGIKSEIVLISTPAWRHAVTAYIYPAGKNQMWIWDADWKSVRIVAFFDNGPQIARAWLALISPGTPLTTAEILNRVN